MSHTFFSKIARTPSRNARAHGRRRRRSTWGVERRRWSVFHRLALLVPLTVTLAAAAFSSTAAARPPAATVELIAFLDLECPFSKRVAPTIERVRKRYGARLLVRIRHNPLPFHKQARLASIAAVAAEPYGKDRRLIKRLLGHQQALDRASLLGHAAAVGVPRGPFAAALDDPALAARVDHDHALAQAIGLSGTPAFTVNGFVIKGAQPLERFVERIDAELAIARAAGARGAVWIRERTRLNNAALARYLYDGETPPTPKVETRKPEPLDPTVYEVPVSAADPSRGPPDALVTAVVFEGVQCPFSKRLEVTLERLMKA